MTTKDIVELFKIKEEVLKEYELLDKYNCMITEWLTTNELDMNQLIRYMLVGFFFDYRAANHKGESFNTIIKAEESKMERLIKKHPDFFKKHNLADNDFIMKAMIFNRYFGREIKDTEDYLNQLKVKQFNSISGDTLFNFVVNGAYTLLHPKKWIKLAILLL